MIFFWISWNFTYVFRPVISFFTHELDAESDDFELEDLFDLSDVKPDPKKLPVVKPQPNALPEVPNQPDSISEVPDQPDPLPEVPKQLDPLTEIPLISMDCWETKYESKL